MKVKIDSVSAVEKKMSVSVSEEYVQTEIEKAYKDVNQKARIPGFRAGKVPRSVLEKKFGPSIEAEVLQELVRDTVSKAIDEHKVEAVYVSEISDPKRVKGEGFSYVASVEVKPTFEIKDYAGVKITGEKIEIDEKKINEALNHIRESQAVLKLKEGATKVKKGEFATLSVKDLTMTPAKEGKDQLYEVGSEQGRKEIDEALKKISVGETTKVSFEDEKSKKAFEVELTLKNVKEKILPELNDELAKSVGAFETMDALKTHLEKELKEEADLKTKAANSRKILDEVLKSNPIDLPKSLVHNELERLIHGVEDRMKQSGMTEVPEEFSHEKLHHQFEGDAKRNVHEQLLLEAIARKEDIKVEANEISERLKMQAQASRIPLAELHAYYQKTGGLSELGFQILVQKTLDFLLAKANIK